MRSTANKGKENTGTFRNKNWSQICTLILSFCLERKHANSRQCCSVVHRKLVQVAFYFFSYSAGTNLVIRTWSKDEWQQECLFLWKRSTKVENVQKWKKDRKKGINHKKSGDFLLAFERVLSYIQLSHTWKPKICLVSTTSQAIIQNIKNKEWNWILYLDYWFSSPLSLLWLYSMALWHGQN